VQSWRHVDIFPFSNYDQTKLTHSHTQSSFHTK
jgi:hypothetical protein